MATNEELIATTRRLISESVASTWSPTVLQAKVNEALASAIQRVIEVVPEEFRRRAVANISVGTDGTRSRYERPTAENVRSYEIKASSGGEYRQMDRITREQALIRSGDIVTLTDGTVRNGYAYYIEGHELVIVPEPPENVTNGLRCTYTEFQAFDYTTDLAEEPYLPVELHPLIAIGAAIRCLEESKDAADSTVDRYRARWAAVFGNTDASTRESRAALARAYRVHEPREIVGMRLGG